MRIGATILFALLVTATVAEPLAGQSAGRIRFEGSGAIGLPAAVLFRQGPPGARLYLVLSPSPGPVTIGAFRTRCFGADPAMTGLLAGLDQLGQADVQLVVPPIPSLVGTWLGSQAFGLGPTLPSTNCAAFLAIGPPAGPEIVETFDDDAQSEPRLGRGDWARSVAGTLSASRLGGSGELGSFDPALGTAVGANTFVFRTDGHAFPATHTLTGTAVTVTDGVFSFLDFRVPAGVIVRFEGPHPARILVAGDAEIDGIVDVSAPAMSIPDGSSALLAGQPGGMGGPGAARGGNGGDVPVATPGVLDAPDGRAGEDLRVPAGHAYSGANEHSGGVGSLAWPLAGDPLAVTYGFFGLYSNQIAGGGGGGAQFQAGVAGSTLAERLPGGDTGPHGSGGRGLPPLSGEWQWSTRELHLIGGSGGGGSGAHPYDSIVLQPVIWARGSGGGGGGGALLLAAAGDVTLGANGAILANGAAAASRTDQDGLLLSPGGGGSGGSVLIQVGGAFLNRGRISAVGGAGGVTEDLRATAGSRVAGGDGGDGRVRIEAAQPAAVQRGWVQPAIGTTVANLTDRDRQVVAVSGWYALPSGAGVMGYELYTREAGRTVAYSDDPGFGRGPTISGVTPVVLLTRFSSLDPTGVPIVGSIEPWASGAARPIGAVDAVQFAIRFDRDSMGAAADVGVETLRLSF